jgi:hypothetical protein
MEMVKEKGMDEDMFTFGWRSNRSIFRVYGQHSPTFSANVSRRSDTSGQRHKMDVDANLTISMVEDELWYRAESPHRQRLLDNGENPGRQNRSYSRGETLHLIRAPDAFLEFKWSNSSQDGPRHLLVSCVQSMRHRLRGSEGFGLVSSVCHKLNRTLNPGLNAHVKKWAATNIG